MPVLIPKTFQWFNCNRGKREWLLHKWNMQVISPSDTWTGSSNANNDFSERCNFPLPQRFSIFCIQSSLVWLEVGLFKFTGEMDLPVLNLCQPRGVLSPRFSNLPGTQGNQTAKGVFVFSMTHRTSQWVSKVICSKKWLISQSIKPLQHQHSKQVKCGQAEWFDSWKSTHISIHCCCRHLDEMG